MPLEVQLMTEADNEEFCRIGRAAFNHGIGLCFMPADITEEQFQQHVAKNLKSMREGVGKGMHCLKVVDTDADTGAMIAAAKWRFYPNGRTEEEVQQDYGQLPEPSPWTNAAAQRAFYEYLNTWRMKCMGTKPFYFLQIIQTDPQHQGRGAAKLLMKWGCDQADRDGIPAYVEASDAGRPLYEKFLFKPIDEKVFDLTEFGATGTERNTIMLREPQTVTAAAAA